MKRSACLFCLFLLPCISGHLRAQSYYKRPSLELTCGYKMYHQKFGMAFNNLEDFSFQKPVQFVGVKETSGLEKGSGINDFHLAWILPKTIRLRDSVPAKVTGVIFGVSTNYDLFKNSEVFDLFFRVGGNLSTLKLYGSEEVRQKNFSSAVKAGLEPKITIGKIVFSCSVEYDYDLTKPRWKKAWFSDSPKTVAAKFWQTGLITLVSLGIRP